MRRSQAPVSSVGRPSPGVADTTGTGAVGVVSLVDCRLVVDGGSLGHRPAAGVLGLGRLSRGRVVSSEVTVLAVGAVVVSGVLGGVGVLGVLVDARPVRAEILGPGLTGAGQGLVGVGRDPVSVERTGLRLVGSVLRCPPGHSLLLSLGRNDRGRRGERGERRQGELRHVGCVVLRGRRRDLLGVLVVRGVDVAVTVLLDDRRAHGSSRTGAMIWVSSRRALSPASEGGVAASSGAEPTGVSSAAAPECGEPSRPAMW